MDRGAEDPDFLNTLGREFCIAFEGLVPDEELSSQDCYSVVAHFLAQPVTPELLKALSLTELQGLTTAFNSYFECDTIKVTHVESAVSRILWHWQGNNP
jgi:hypothetical protein